jgi:hypothetical protein
MAKTAMLPSVRSQAPNHKPETNSSLPQSNLTLLANSLRLQELEKDKKFFYNQRLASSRQVIRIINTLWSSLPYLHQLLWK